MEAQNTGTSSDVESLTWEIRGSGVDESEANVAIKKIHAAYTAGMAVLRFQSMALKACPGMDLIDQLVYFLRHYEEAHRRIKFNYGTRQLPHPSVDERDLSEHRFERIACWRQCSWPALARPCSAGSP